MPLQSQMITQSRTRTSLTAGTCPPRRQRCASDQLSKALRSHTRTPADARALVPQDAAGVHGKAKATPQTAKALTQAAEGRRQHTRGVQRHNQVIKLIHMERHVHKSAEGPYKHAPKADHVEAAHATSPPARARGHHSNHAPQGPGFPDHHSQASHTPRPGAAFRRLRRQGSHARGRHAPASHTQRPGAAYRRLRSQGTHARGHHAPASHTHEVPKGS